ncbi:MAG: hypothetical protein COT81_02685 [Candidatus Buchananbacteria bacterium CG10_big_fil_rev_8_21_14_0_10_42_9]|uniref:CxxC-x17-CxxC domain-containing protein n=1 Tax=Candidatus Buchananbacteria bacterium CG10_big_fil_rev_8_21_14_0_10_42_9 TaxID=1974526 RepID=A0A2H0W1A1_9BACT|nr:MAG: hypothetical protein COT81_02685 [Candidatus Buchananbacteria bacterium CG10_big_fil_rev_8_21_14_0_10_42_9]
MAIFGLGAGDEKPKRPERKMYKTKCTNCGKDAEVPFEPTGDKPVYCNDCFKKLKGARNQKPQAKSPALAEELRNLNRKLDKIIQILTDPNLKSPAPVKNTAAKPATEKPAEKKAATKKTTTKKATTKKSLEAPAQTVARSAAGGKESTAKKK